MISKSAKFAPAIVSSVCGIFLASCDVGTSIPLSDVPPEEWPRRIELDPESVKNAALRGNADAAFGLASYNAFLANTNICLSNDKYSKEAIYWQEISAHRYKNRLSLEGIASCHLFHAENRSEKMDVRINHIALAIWEIQRIEIGSESWENVNSSLGPTTQIDSSNPSQRSLQRISIILRQIAEDVE